MPLIGRKKEVAELERYYNQDNAVFIAVYGRRRIGKTFLVNKFFKTTSHSKSRAYHLQNTNGNS